VPTGVNYAQVAVAAASSLTVSDRVQLLGSTSGTYAASSSGVAPRQRTVDLSGHAASGSLLFAS